MCVVADPHFVTCLLDALKILLPRPFFATPQCLVHDLSIEVIQHVGPTCELRDEVW